MIIMKNFTGKAVIIDGVSVEVATDETGADWYESQKNFQTDTLKVIFDTAGVIVSMSNDVTALRLPVGNSVAEIAPDSIPDGIDINGGWVFDGEKITQRVYTSDELVTQAETKRNSLTINATEAIAPLQDLVDIGEATDEDVELLNEWKTYRVALNRLDLSTAPAIDWPTPPQS